MWDGNGPTFSKAAVQNAGEKNDKRWLLLTNDYVWGHTTAAATKAQVEKAGGQIIDNLLIPQNTRDFTSYLLKVQQIKPDVIATAVGGDDIKALRQQVSELKLEEKAAWINNQQDWPDIWGAPETLFGVFGTTWYHLLPLPGVSEFVKRWQAAYPQSPIPVPGNVSYNGYMAARSCSGDRARWLHQQPQVIKALEGHKMPAADRSSTSMPTLTRRRIKCSRPSIWPAAMQSPRTRRTCTRSSAGRSPRIRWMTPHLANAS